MTLFRKNAVSLFVVMVCGGGFQPVIAASLRIAPASTVIGLSGASRAILLYTPTAPPSLEQVVDPSQYTLVSDNPSVALVLANNAGIYGQAKGTANITTTYSGLSAALHVNVRGTTQTLNLATPDGRTRTYILYVPDGVSPGAAMPLVINFHGSGGDAQSQLDMSQMNVTADAHGFIAAYPNGTGSVAGQNTWNGGACCGYAVDHHVDDVGFVRLLISDISGRYSVDPNRIYATGFSNGAILSHRLACQLSDRIAAIAPASGGLNLGGDFTSCAPLHPVPVIEFHGTTDTAYPYNGGAGVGGIVFYGIPSTIQDWVTRDHLSSPGATVYQNGIESCTAYAAENSSIRVQLCTAQPATPLSSGGVVYDGGGHAWPGGVRIAQNLDLPTPDVDASETLWTFLSATPLSSLRSVSGLAQVQIFPNPLRPAVGHTQMNFSQMPPAARVRIYTLAGEKVRDFTADAAGSAAWDGANSRGQKVASGVYFVEIEGTGGKQTYKVAVQR